MRQGMTWVRSGASHYFGTQIRSTARRQSGVPLHRHNLFAKRSGRRSQSRVRKPVLFKMSHALTGVACRTGAAAITS